MKYTNTSNRQAVSCEIIFAHAHVRARSHVCDVRAKGLLERACDVRACGRFQVRRAIAISHVFGLKMTKFWTLKCIKKYIKFEKFTLKLSFF